MKQLIFFNIFFLFIISLCAVNGDDKYCDDVFNDKNLMVLLEIDNDTNHLYPSYEYQMLNNITINYYRGAHFNGTKMRVICKKVLDKILKAESIIFDNVNFETIEDDAWENLINLKYLGIINENIQKFNFNIHDLSNLKLITLEGDRIREIQRHTFYDLPKLKILQLSNNDIEEIDDWCKNCPLLSEISLNNNQIRKLNKNAFHAINTDLRINLTLNNNLEYIEDGALDHIKEIGILYLSRNKLTVIPDRFLHNLRNGYKLDLSFNRLNCIPEHLFAKMDYIDLIGNPITEDCLELIKRLRIKYNMIVVHEALN